MDKGYAYRCFCSSQRLELLRKEQMMRRETFQVSLVLSAHGRMVFNGAGAVGLKNFLLFSLLG